jgi:hypothetical protein
LAVALSTRNVELHESNNWYGGTQETTRQVTGPEQPIWVLHCP